MIVLGKSGKRNVGFNLDVLLRTRALFQANSGGGKSWALRRLAEELFPKVQVIIIDREGEFATLREKFGFVLVGKGGDTPADPRSAALVAHKLLELRASAVCDLYEMKESERHRWLRVFLEAVIDCPKALWHPVVFIIDEIHCFAPEKGSGESEASEAVIGLATRGRKRGFCLVGATQRLGKFRKDVAAELLNVVIGQTFMDVDVKRAVDALGVQPSDARAFANDLKMLEPGNFYVLGRAIAKERTSLLVGDVQTTHPELGSSKHAAKPPPPPSKIKALLPKLADLPKEAEEKAKTEAELKVENRSLKMQLAARPKAVAQPVAKQVTKTVTVEIVKQGQLKKIDRLVMRCRKIVGKAELLGGQLHEAVNKLSSLDGQLSRIRAIPNRAVLPPTTSSVRVQVSRSIVPALVVRPAPVRAQEGSNGDGTLNKCQRAVLTVLAQNPDDGCEMGKLTLLAGYRKSGGFMNTLASLRVSGYIVGSNTGVMKITTEGIVVLGDYDPLPAGHDLADYWLRHQSFGTCERKVLEVFLENPDGLTGQEVADASSYKMSGGFMNALSRLRTAGVIVGRNTEKMTANPELLG